MEFGDDFSEALKALDEAKMLEAPGPGETRRANDSETAAEPVATEEPILEVPVIDDTKERLRELIGREIARMEVIIAKTDKDRASFPRTLMGIETAMSVDLYVARGIAVREIMVRWGVIDAYCALEPPEKEGEDNIFWLDSPRHSQSQFGVTLDMDGDIENVRYKFRAE